MAPNLDVAAALAAAEEHCRGQQVALTPNRRFMLQQLLEAGRPMKAYELLPRLQAAGRPSNPASAYQALRALQAAGLVGRIETLNAFVARAPGEAGHAVLVCRACEDVTPIHIRIEGAARAAARRHAFGVEDWICEVVGVCARCRGVAWAR